MGSSAYPVTTTAGNTQREFTLVYSFPSPVTAGYVGTYKFADPSNLYQIISCWLTAGTSPTGADLIADVNKNGTTIFTTQANRPKVLAGDIDGVGVATVPDITGLAEGDRLTVDIDQVGSTVAGDNVSLHVILRRLNG